MARLSPSPADEGRAARRRLFRRLAAGVITGYVAARASCHYNGAGKVNPARPDLALNSAVHLSSPDNLVRVILFGIDAPEGAPGLVMPAYGKGMGDADVAHIAADLRRPRTHEAPWPNLEKTVAALRAQGKGVE